MDSPRSSESELPLLGVRTGDKADQEAFLANKFLEHLGIAHDDPIAREVNDRPDLVYSLRLGGEAEQRVGMEVTEYQADASPKGGSSARQRDGLGYYIWTKVQSEYFPRHPELRELYCLFILKECNPPKRSDLDDFTSELVRFILDNMTRADPGGVMFDSSKSIRKDKDRADPSSESEAYPLLKAHLDHLDVRRTGSDNNMWLHGGAAFVSLNRDILNDIMLKKTRARKKYSADCDECWLLICASGATTADGAGPKPLCERSLGHEGILRLAAGSGFDRVYFWERVQRWHALLHPAE